MKKTSATPEDLEKFREMYLEYSAKNIIREGGFIFVVLLGNVIFTEFRWEKLVIVFVASIAFAYGNIALHRYMHKRGNLYIPPSPKYGDKTYAEHQAEKAAKSKDE